MKLILTHLITKSHDFSRDYSHVNDNFRFGMFGIGGDPNHEKYMKLSNFLEF